MMNVYFSEFICLRYICKNVILKTGISAIFNFESTLIVGEYGFVKWIRPFLIVNGAYKLKDFQNL